MLIIMIMLFLGGTTIACGMEEQQTHAVDSQDRFEVITSDGKKFYLLPQEIELCTVLKNMVGDCQTKEPIDITFNSKQFTPFYEVLKLAKHDNEILQNIAAAPRRWLPYGYGQKTLIDCMQVANYCNCKPLLSIFLDMYVQKLMEDGQRRSWHVLHQPLPKELDNLIVQKIIEKRYKDSVFRTLFHGDLKMLQTYSKNFRFLRFSPCGKYLFYKDSNELHIWNTTMQREVKHSLRNCDIIFVSKDDSFVILYNNDKKTFMRWNIGSSERPQFFFKTDLQLMEINDIGNLIALHSKKNPLSDSIFIFDITKNKTIKKINASKDGVFCFMSNTPYFVWQRPRDHAWESSREFEVWNSLSNQTHTFKMSHPVSEITCSPDSKLALYDEHTISFLTINDYGAHPINTYSFPYRIRLLHKWSPDGTYYALEVSHEYSSPTVHIINVYEKKAIDTGISIYNPKRFAFLPGKSRRFVIYKAQKAEIYSPQKELIRSVHIGRRRNGCFFYEEGRSADGLYNAFRDVDHKVYLFGPLFNEKKIKKVLGKLQTRELLLLENILRSKGSMQYSLPRQMSKRYAFRIQQDRQSSDTLYNESPQESTYTFSDYEWPKPLAKVLPCVRGEILPFVTKMAKTPNIRTNVFARLLASEFDLSDK